MNRSAIFIFDLVQDVNTLRRLMALARIETSHELLAIVSTNFEKFDITGLWGRELREVCGLLGIPVHRFTSEFEAMQILQSRSGLLISASESDARAHARSHELFRAAPAGFIRVTLQHGFECLGFLHNGAHDRTHWQHAIFNADIICGWFGNGLLRSIAPAQLSKLVVTGPPLLIDCGNLLEPVPMAGNHAAPLEAENAREGARPACLICENLHSVRLGGNTLKSGFMAQFVDFSREAASRGFDVWLRPHPAGRYSDVKGLALPEGVQKSVGPIYKEDLRRFSFAISAPSSILFDFILAGVPVAIWQDEQGTIDCRNYPRLPVVSSVEDWLAFGEDVQARGAEIAAAQRAFVERLAMPDDVTKSYRDLLRSVASIG